MLRSASLALFLLLVLFATGCSRPPQDSAAPDSAADVLVPAPQLAAVDLALMTGTWQWVGTNRPSDRVEPKDPSRYTVAFQADSTVAVHADCNSGSGRYTLIAGQKIELGPVTTTLMGCPEGSLDSEFLRELSAAEGYALSGDTLSLTLKLEAGTMRFVRESEGGS